MGGLYGHMYHLYDNPNLSFADIFDVIQKASSGKLVGTEKTDGQNLYVSFSIPQDKAVAARNKTEIGGGGIDSDQLGDKFKGRGPLEYSFADALRAFESFVRNLSTEMQKEIFGAQANRFYNIEVMSPETPNVINYDTKIVTIHRAGGMIRTDSGPKPDPSEKGVELIEKIFKQVEDLANQGEHRLAVNAIQTLRGLDNDTHAKRAMARIKKIIADEGLNDGDTIGEYIVKLVSDEVDKSFPELDMDTKKMIVSRVMKVKGVKLTDIYKKMGDVENETKVQVKDFVNVSPLLLKRGIFPIEDAIHDFAVEMLRGVHSLYVLDNDAEVFRMRKEVENAIQQITSTGDEEEMDKLKSQMDKLKDLGNVSSAAEGFVFNYDGNTYKFTGNFAPINQIMGILRYGKGAATRMVKEEGSSGTSIALFPGKFKPPHSGHFAAAEAGMNKTGKVYVIISEREHEGVTGDLSLWMWEKYVEAYGYGGKMIPVLHSELAKGAKSPIQTTYEYVDKMKSGSNATLVLGKKDIEDGRYAGVGKDRQDVNVSMYPVVFGNISGTKMRAFAKNNDFQNFNKNLPAKLKPEERKEVFEMVKSNVLSEAPGSSVIAKAPKDPVRIGIGKDALYNLVEDVFNEQASLAEKEILENHEYIQNVLGITLAVNESGAVVISDGLKQIILREHFILEGFLDNLVGAVKKSSGEIKKLFTSFYHMIRDKTGSLVSAFIKVLNRMLSSTYEKITNALTKVESISQIGNIARAIKEKFANVVKRYNEMESGWKKMIIGSSVFLGIQYIYSKVGDLIDKILEKEGSLETAKEKIKKVFLDAVGNFFGEDFLKNALNAIADVKKWLGWIGPIVGGVSFVSKELSRATTYVDARASQPEAEIREVAAELGNAPKNYNALYAEETFKFMFASSDVIPEKAKDKFMDTVQDNEEEAKKVLVTYTSMKQSDPEKAKSFIIAWSDEMNEISSVSGGGVEGFAGAIGGQKKKKKTIYR